MPLTREEQCTPQELETVMQKYGKTVYRLAYAQTHSRADADDIYQEVFLRYFQKRPGFESEEHRKAWLLRVTINRAKSHFATAWFRHTVPLEECDGFAAPEERLLDEAMGALRPGDRCLLQLFYYEQLSVRGIADLLKRKESTVRTQLTRARQRLGKLLKGEIDDGKSILQHE